jgi:5-methyltetrahydrofolate--homocysteine methyltransferase
LTNNGYEVINLGIKVGVNEMLSAVEEAQADALGMSGLLVKSTLIMRENLEIMNERAMSNVPVLLGGAALTRTYVERDLREVYSGRLFYGKDAFEGLRVLDQLGDIRRGGTDDPTFGRELSRRTSSGDFAKKSPPARSRPREAPRSNSTTPLRASISRESRRQGHESRRDHRVS